MSHAAAGLPEGQAKSSLSGQWRPTQLQNHGQQWQTRGFCTAQGPKQTTGGTCRLSSDGGRPPRQGSIKEPSGCKMRAFLRGVTPPGSPGHLTWAGTERERKNRHSCQLLWAAAGTAPKVKPESMHAARIRSGRTISTCAHRGSCSHICLSVAHKGCREG